MQAAVNNKAPTARKVKFALAKRLATYLQAHKAPLPRTSVSQSLHAQPITKTSSDNSATTAVAATTSFVATLNEDQFASTENFASVNSLEQLANLKAAFQRGQHVLGKSTVPFPILPSPTPTQGSRFETGTPGYMLHHTNLSSASVESEVTDIEDFDPPTLSGNFLRRYNGYAAKRRSGYYDQAGMGTRTPSPSSSLGKGLFKSSVKTGEEPIKSRLSRILKQSHVGKVFGGPKPTRQCKTRRGEDWFANEL